MYEMTVNQIAVMRRRHDSWLNATQILKVAGIDKGKRTKVLEKEVLTGEHEKVQGGYGKYQGTWINYARGREFCRQYGVEEVLRPLLEHDMGQDGMTVAGKGRIETPTKEQAMAAQRKRIMLNGGMDNRPPARSPSGTFFKNISNTAANAVNAIHRARFDSPVPRPGSGSKRPASARRPSQQMMGSQESAYPGSSQQSMQSLHSESSFGGINGQLEPAFGTHTTPYFTSSQKRSSNHDMQEPPRKRPRPSSAQDPYAVGVNGAYDISMQDATFPEPNDSYMYHNGFSQHAMESAVLGVQPLPQPIGDAAQEKVQLLTSLFLDSSQTDFSNHPAFSRLSGEDLDIPIDATAHTALHWAATLARTSLLSSLIKHGASIYRVNGGGETALIRAALTTNNLDQSSFPELLKLLGPTIEMRDGRGRTVLHHIAVSSAVKGRSPACRYYLESLLEFVVHEGSTFSNQQSSFDPSHEAHGLQPARSMGLARFMSEIVNAVDMSGDTALNLAARIGNKSIIQQLLEVGANPTIANRGGLKPVDFGVGGEPEPDDSQPSSQASLPPHERTHGSKVNESSQDVMACKLPLCLFSYLSQVSILTITLCTAMSSLLSDTESSFRSELQSKQSLIEQAHAKLRETSSLLVDDRRRLEDLQSKADERKELKQQISNLRHGDDDFTPKTANNVGVNGIGAANGNDVAIGDADAGLDIDPALLPPSPPSPSQPSSLSPSRQGYLQSLPEPEILNARLSAYKVNNAGLQEQATMLKNKSVDMEGKLRKVVALCTGVAEERVDGMLEGLVVAVESEKGEDVEVGRVREFLRKVEGI